MLMDDMLPTQRVALVSWWLRDGWDPTPRELAHRVGITPWGARLMLVKLCAVLPLREEPDGRWRVVVMDGEPGE